MPNMTETVTHLSQVIGSRPAGTEEEQQAALYIEETFKKEVGLPVRIDEFAGATGNDMTRLICAAVSIVGALLFMITPALAIPGLLLALAAAAVFAADYMDKPLIARFFSKGVSQNVVAKYKPEGATTDVRGRRRKVVVVTRYDSGKVRPELANPFLRGLGIANKVSAGAIVFILFWLVIRSIFAMYPEGGVAVFLNVVTFLAMVCAALPLILKALAQTSAYNDGANGSASGVAVMVDVAKRVMDSSLVVPEAYDQDEEPVVHGMDQAYDQGLIPEGAEVAYEVAPTVEDEYQPQSFDQFETASFQPVVVEAPAQVEVPAAIPEPQPVVEAAPVAPAQPVAPVVAAAPAAAVVATAAVASAPVQKNEGFQGYDDVPSWFKAAQEKAKKSSQPVKVARSVYADALEAALPQRQPEPEPEPVVIPQADPVAYAAPVAEQAPVVPVQPVAPVVPAEPVVEVAPQPVVEAAPVAPEPQPVAEPEVAPAEAVVEAPVEAAPVERELPVGHVAEGEDILSNVLTEDLNDLAAAPEVALPAFLTGEAPASDNGRVVVTSDASEDDEIAEAAGQTAPSKTGRVVLPDVVATNLAPIDEVRQQRAPLADGAEGVTATAKGLLNMLPSISLSMPRVSKEGKPARPSINLPSLSGSMSAIATDEKKTGSAGMTGAFAPVADALVDHVEKEEDLYIDDADDSEFEENFTENGAYAGPDYVEMPKSRFGGFFDKLFNKGGNARPSARAQQSTSEWLDVDEDFDARSVGEARGDWDSFQEDSEWNAGETTAFDNSQIRQATEEDYQPDNYRRWEGGAFSSIKDKVAGAASGAAGAVGGALGNAKDKLPFGGGAEQQEEAPARSRRNRPAAAEGDEPRPARVRGARRSEFADLNLGLTPEAYEKEQEAIEQFANPAIQTEVWFVALGSDLDGNAGMKAFLDQNAPEMRGAVIIELDSVGAGDLCMVNPEGSLKPVKTSSRMKRFVRKANQALGVSIGTAEMTWNDSASSFANSHGCQAMHLAGMEGGKPALFAEADDVAENVDERSMNLASDYVMELIRTI